MIILIEIVKEQKLNCFSRGDNRKYQKEKNGKKKEKNKHLLERAYLKGRNKVTFFFLKQFLYFFSFFLTHTGYHAGVSFLIPKAYERYRATLRLHLI